MIEFRDFKNEDADLLVSYLNNTASSWFVSSRIPQPYTPEAAQWWINTGSKIGFSKAIIFNGNFVGTIGAIPGEMERQKSALIGYWIAEPFWGKGIATEALKQFIDIVFSTTDVHRLHATAFAANCASAKVLLKCGFKHEATLEKSLYKNCEFFDELYFSLFRKSN